jgi:hypothetical protein
MNKIYIDLGEKFVNRFIIGVWGFNGLLFLKMREDRREQDLEKKIKEEIYENVKNGRYM